MINAAHIIVPGMFLIGAIKSNAQPQDEWKPTSSDTRALREGMMNFETRVIGKRKWYPFEQYCLSKGIIGHTEEGMITVVSPTDWSRINRTWDLMKWQDNQDLKKLLAANPEEREAYEARLEEVKVGIRALFTGMKVTN
jgi:hypothetical protein